MTQQITKIKETPTQEVSLKPSVAENAPIVKQEFDIDGFLAMRAEFISKVNKIMVKGSDYHEIQGKKSLAKGGAEKIASIFGWTATFTKDTDVAEAFGDIKGLIAFVCNLTKGDTIIGQGRGAATLVKNSGDPNKAIKMAQKSAFIDAVLRASGLSDFFTQDLEDHPEHLPQQPTKPGKYRGSEAQMTLIGRLCKEKNVTKEELTDIIKRMNFSYAGDVIDYLKAVPYKTPQQELPVVEEGTVTGEDIPFGYPDDIGAK